MATTPWLRSARACRAMAGRSDPDPSTTRVRRRRSAQERSAEIQRTARTPTSPQPMISQLVQAHLRARPGSPRCRQRKAGHRTK
ncbi:MAG: hypothetical protein D6702_00950 [Planctomycetota bacterium]|nr:MAG: hypothetical protein D6702_00950 [Planctomycetota bacterium]